MGISQEFCLMIDQYSTLLLFIFIYDLGQTIYLSIYYLF